ncbi:outer membrane protein assembly factor BamB family protein, partial [Candidatus Halobonum tyrrellensis]
VVAGGVALVPAETGLFAFDAGSGEPLWRHGGERDRPYGVAVADGVAYVTMRDEPTTLALALDDGSEVWRAAADADFASAPLVAPSEDRVYAGDTTGRVVARDATDGEPLWTFDAFTGVYALAARRDALFVGTTGGETYELLAARDRVVPLWRRKLPGTVRALTADARSVFAATFDAGWFRLRPGARAGRTEWHAAGAPTVTESLVHAGSTLVGAGPDGVAAHRPRGGGRLWSIDNGAGAPASAPA